MIELSRLLDSEAKIIVKWNEGKDESFLYQWAGKLAYAYPITEDQILNRMKTNDLEILKINNDGVIIGTLEIELTNISNQRVRFGKLLISDEYRACGFGTLAIQQLEQYVYDRYAVEELELGVFEFNTSAKKLYERLGFKEIDVKVNEEDARWNSYTMIKKR